MAVRNIQGLVVEVPNTPGQLLNVLNSCMKAGVSVQAAACSSSEGGKALIYIVPDKPADAKQTLTANKLSVRQLELLEVSGGDKVGACCSFVSELAGIDIQHFMGFGAGGKFTAYVEVPREARDKARAAIAAVKL